MSSEPGLAGRVARLALPALVVLAAEPLYLLVDTAVVGHLGSIPLGGLAVGGTLMASVNWLGTVLAYGTTSRAARAFGAGDRRAAVTEGVQASWLAIAVGVVMAVVAQFAAGPVMSAFVGGPDAEAIRAGGETWLRIASLGAPGFLLALAGNGWMRGVQDTRRPLVFVLAGNGLSAIACPILVYPLGFGLAGSAIANVGAQLVVGSLFVWALRREAVSLRPNRRLIRAQIVVGRDLVLRTASMQACFLSASAVASRISAAALGGHQIALQLWMFLALVLDSVAIAAQSLVGEAIGARRFDTARAVAWRVTAYGGVAGVVFAGGLLAATAVLPRLFTSDTSVISAAQEIWPLFALTQVLAGVVFALDGVLIGAGDLRYLRNVTIVSTLGGFLPLIWLAYAFDWGLRGVWVGLVTFMVIRLVGMVARLLSPRWTQVGELT